MKKTFSILLLAIVLVSTNNLALSQDTGVKREWGTITTA